MSDEASKVDNGVDVVFLMGAREQLKEAPQAAQFKFRATTTWVRGTHSSSAVSGYFGLGAEHQHRTTFTIESDHPELFNAEDNGATAPEIVLSALGCCLTGGMASIAQNRDIQLRSVVARIEGSMNLQGLLGVDDEVRNGFNDIKVTYEIDADASGDDIEALVAQAQKRSPVFDMLTSPTNVTVEVA